MATRANRRRLVSASSQFENAEGVIPLKFPRNENEKFVLHKLVDADQTNRRNELPQVKFTIMNPRNCDTVGVMAQGELRDEILKGFALKANGVTIPVTVHGNRASKDFITGMPNVFAKDLKVEIPEQNAPVVPPPATTQQVSQSVQ